MGRGHVIPEHFRIRRKSKLIYVKSTLVGVAFALSGIVVGLVGMAAWVHYRFHADVSFNAHLLWSRQLWFFASILFLLGFFLAFGRLRTSG